MSVTRWRIASVLTVFCFCILSWAAPASAQSWPNGYQYRRAVTISHTQVPNSDQSNFPVLISGTYSYLATTANGGQVTNANGYDILFAADSNGLSPLAFEQESYNPSTGAVVYWVKVPTVSHTADTVIYMFYANSSISTYQSNKNQVWDSNYLGIWHSGESSGNLLDSTSNNNPGTPTSVTQGVAGEVGNAASYNGSSSHVNFGNASLLNPTQITLSAWIKATSYPNTYNVIFSKVQTNDPYLGYELRVDGGNLNFYIATGGAGSYFAASTPAPSTNVWHYVAGTYDGNNLKLFVDGTQVSSVAHTGSMDAANGSLWIGDDASFNGRVWNGNIDEARISNIARSADAVATEYHNQSSPSTFYSIGAAAQGSVAYFITGISPTTAHYGDSVTIQGTAFGFQQENSTVSLNGANLPVQAWGETQISVNVPLGASSGYFTVTIGGQSFLTPFLAITPLTSGWSDGDVGTVGLPGSANYANDVFTVNGAGSSGASGSSDQINFLYQSLSGDGTIIARLASLQGPSGAQAGLMIRETLNPGATNMFLCYCGTIGISWRSTTGGSTSSTGIGGLNPPMWLKLVRSGNTFTAYDSPDGATWSQVGSAQTISMAQNVFIGMATSSISPTMRETATFNNVSINTSSNPAPVINSLSATTGPGGSQIAINGANFGVNQSSSVVTLGGTPITISGWSNTQIVVTLPANATSGPIVVSVAPGMNDSNGFYFTVESQPLPFTWLDSDVGTVGTIGNATFSSAGGSFAIAGAGWGTASTPDEMHLVYQLLSGDGTIVARLVSLQGGGGSGAEAGLIIRETLNASASDAAVYYSQTFIDSSQRTSTGGNSSSQNDVGVTLPYWMKLVRSGNSFSTYASPDGVNWTQYGSTQTITMAQNVDIGMFVGSGTSSLATVTFDNVSINSTANPAPVITAVSATTGSVGSQVHISGSNFGANENTSVVRLNGTPVTLNSWSSTSIIITIPTRATSGPLVVSVAPGMIDSNAVDFTVTSQPLPAPWLDQDVGPVGLVGSATYSSGAFTVKGAGLTGAATTPDTIHFAYQPMSGDGTFVARLASYQGNSAGEYGIMIRETLDPSAKDAAVYYNQSVMNMLERTSTGGFPQSQLWNNGPVTLPYWLKLVRSGGTFSSYASADGVTWVQVGSTQTISMATNAYVGFFVSNNNASTNALATATFDNASIVLGTTPIVTGMTPSLGPVNTTVTVTGSNFGSTQGTLTFGGVTATSYTSWTNSQVVANVPSGAASGADLVNVTENSITGISFTSFTVIKPTVTSVTPPAAEINGNIVVNGSGFGANQASSQVLFNGTAVGVNSWSDTAIALNIPPGITSGPVTVNVDGVVSNGVQFTILEPLAVSGISPSSGPAGTTVTITGAGFGPTQSNSTVTIFNSTANVTSWNDTQIQVTVPGGTLSGAVGVEVAGVPVYGPNFTVNTTPQLKDSMANTTNYTSAMIGGVWRLTSSQGSGCSSCTERGQISYTYDGNGNVLTRTDELGHTTSYTYDGNGNVLTVTVPINANTTATTTYTYNNFGEVLTMTDPLGNVTTNTFDANGNLLSVTTPAPNGTTAASVAQFAYNALGELTSITDPLNNKTTLTYTTAGLIQTITDAQSHVTTYGYDAHGNRTSVKDANNQTTTFAYDAGDRLKTITYPDNTTTSFTYDGRGRRTSVTDQNGKVTTYAYDDADRLTTVTDTANHVTTYGYDTESSLTSIKDANSNTTSFGYDAFRRITKTTFPSGNFENYGYDAAGNLTSKTDRKNQLITYTYDQLNRLTQKTYPDNTTVNYTYDNDSRLTQVTDPTGTYNFTFDNMGRLTNTTTSYAFLTGRNFTTAYGYDAASNRTGFTDPESGSTTYAYDTLNRLQTLTPPSAFTTGNFGFGYDALSRRTSLTRPNSVKTTYAYDNLSRLTSVLHQLSGSTIDGATYTLDNAGNRILRTPQPSGTASNYTYDAIYELTQVTQGATTTESYTYDPVGNRLSDLTTSGWSNNTSNELTSRPGVSYTFDNNGNILTKVVGSNTTTYGWDFENRMTSVTLPGSGGTVSFKYDPFGRRIYKSSSSGTSIFAYDGPHLLEEANSSGAVVARYAQSLHIDEPLAMLRGGVTSYYNADGLGSITSLANGAGALAQTYTFDSFGNLTSSSGSLTNPFRYTAREFDTETNLYYYRARYVDQSTGRFLSEDPARFNGGINLYAYVRNEPIDFVDPYGLKCTQVTPWQEIPTMSPNPRKPYASYEDGLFWQLETWDFANGPEGGTVISCICTWIATRTRVRKFYRENVTEEAWFECADCGKPSQRERRTRTKLKEWEVDSPGNPIIPSPDVRRTTGPAVQIGRDSGADPSGLSTKCLCPPPAP